MNTFWLKIAAVVIIVLVVVIAVSRYTGSKPGGSHAVVTVEDEPQAEKPKTFGDVIAKDDKRLRAEPNQALQVHFKELTEEEKVGAE
jgi:PDZ domain-containing secreted protein